MQRIKLFFKKLWFKSPFVTALAIDINSISNIYIGDEKKYPSYWMNIYHDYKILYYKSTDITGKRKYNAPIVIKNGWFTKKRFVDISKMSEIEKKELTNIINNTDAKN